jgi:hypothetical protein
MLRKIQELMQATPYVPFVIHTADGKSYEIPHPDFVSVHIKLGQAIVSWDGDHYVTLSGLLISGVETKPTLSTRA